MTLVSSVSSPAISVNANGLFQKLSASSLPVDFGNISSRSVELQVKGYSVSPEDMAHLNDGTFNSESVRVYAKDSSSPAISSYANVESIGFKYGVRDTNLNTIVTKKWSVSGNIASTYLYVENWGKATNINGSSYDFLITLNDWENKASNLMPPVYSICTVKVLPEPRISATLQTGPKTFKVNTNMNDGGTKIQLYGSAGVSVATKDFRLYPKKPDNPLPVNLSPMQGNGSNI